MRHNQPLHLARLPRAQIQSHTRVVVPGVEAVRATHPLRR
jgi:hypothetical protein